MQTFTLAWGRRNRRSVRGTGTDGSILCAGITHTGRIRQEHLSPNGNTNTRPGKANRRRMTTVPLGQMRLPAALVLCTLSFLLPLATFHLPPATPLFVAPLPSGRQSTRRVFSHQDFPTIYMRSIFTHLFMPLFISFLSFIYFARYVRVVVVAIPRPRLICTAIFGWPPAFTGETIRGPQVRTNA